MEAKSGSTTTGFHHETDCNSNNPINDHQNSGEDDDRKASFHHTSEISSCGDSFLQDSGGFQWCLDYSYNGSREFEQSTQKQPQSIFVASLHHNDISYDDLSKNIDANLAEIDMETFRTEDINSILKLPTLHCGEFQSPSRGERCASVSGSLLGHFDLDSSVSPHSTSEESAEMSICKDEPLFSPVKEQVLGTISVDSLDYNCLEEHDLVLTCQAVKDNYTIAFQGSATQLSDDSDLPSRSQGQGFMIQSDVGFTTWSKVRNKSEMDTSQSCGSTIKSHSLPNLLQQSLLLSASHLSQWQPGCVPLYDLHNSQSAHSRESYSSSSPRSVSLLKLFVQQKLSQSLSASISSSQSESSGCLITPPRNQPDRNLHTAENMIKNKEYSSPTSKPPVHYGQLDLHKEDVVQRQKNLDSGIEKGTNVTLPYDHLVLTNMQTSENNNTILSEITDNNNVTAKVETEEEEENSQYFEDSLMEVALPRTRLSHTTSPIKEEEEMLEGSSSDETMKDSKDPFGSDSGTSEEGVLLKNNAVGSPVSTRRIQCVNVERIQNIFPTTKHNRILVNKSDNFDHIRNHITNQFELGHTQGTQTKRLNSNDSSPMEGSQSDSATGSISDDTLNNARRNSCKDHSEWPARASPTFSTGSYGSLNRKSNVIITTTRHCATQIPVHIKDQAIQTSVTEDGKSWSFTRRDSDKSESDGSVPSEEIVSKPSGSNSSSTSSERKPIYICYPNYSLPDLSFLKTIQGSLETPEMVCLPSAKSSQPEKPVVRRRARSSEGRCRPKSYSDVEVLSRLNHIQDWDSLSVLLPKELKGVLKRMQHTPDETGATDKCPSAAPDSPPPLPRRSLSLAPEHEDRQQVPRSILRKSSSNSDEGQCSKTVRSKLDNARSKRWSLQEPVQQVKNIPDRAGLETAPASVWLPDQPSHGTIGNQCTKLTCCCKSLEKHGVHSPLTRTSSDGYHSQNTSSEKESVCPCGQSHRLGNSDPSTNAVSGNTSSGNSPNCSCTRSKKSVSFCDHVALSGILFRDGQAPCKQNENNSPCAVCGGASGGWLVGQDGGRGHTPDQGQFSEDTDVEHPPQEFAVSPPPISSTATSSPAWFALLQSKAGLVRDLQKAVHAVTVHFSLEMQTDQQDKSGKLQPSSVGEQVVKYLCPAIHALLSDGLLPEVPGLLGPVSNSVWRVIESSVDQSQRSKGFQELIQSVNGEKSLTDNRQKFYAFILGLLNVAWLDRWLAHLLTSGPLVLHHYHPTAFLSLLSLPAASHHYRELISIVQPFASLPFALELTLATWKCQDIPLDSNKTTQDVEPSQPASSEDTSKTLTCVTQEKVKTPKHNSVLWSGTSVYPFSQHGETNADDSSKGAAGGHQEQPPAEKEDIATSGDSGCSSQTDRQPTKEEGQHFQQLRQRWEQLTCRTASPAVTRRRSARFSYPPKSKGEGDSNIHRSSSGNLSPRRKSSSPHHISSKSPTPESSPVHQKHSAVSSNLTDDKELQANKPTPVGGCQRRSLIPVHKKVTRGLARRSGSAPAERGQR